MVPVAGRGSRMQQTHGRDGRSMATLGLVDCANDRHARWHDFGRRVAVETQCRSRIRRGRTLSHLLLHPQPQNLWSTEISLSNVQKQISQLVFVQMVSNLGQKHMLFVSTALSVEPSVCSISLKNIVYCVINSVFGRVWRAGDSRSTGSSSGGAFEATEPRQ